MVETEGGLPRRHATVTKDCRVFFCFFFLLHTEQPSFVPFANHSGINTPAAAELKLPT